MTGAEGVLAGKNAVVTGGSRGIGRAVVERLCRDGARVVLTYRREREAADEVCAAVRAGGGQAYAVRLDLADAAATEQAMAAADARLGGLDILVNNAARTSARLPLAETGTEHFDEVLTVNTRAVFLTTRYAARHLRDGGRIITVSTANTVRPGPGIAPYVMSKGAVEQLMAVAAHELGARGITANTVSPGATDTDMLRGANPPEALAALPAMTPLARLGTPSDIADVIAFLAGPDGRWITGQNVRATGGLA
ncbi:SDR family oxidoreductase [Streptomyces evansiae]|uniref:SDR family oxidoreductase n=1 Tax=Streptomyces evansiae TaxID=3075535 RepID=UPI002884618F|nr:SDR family oxidoreductase [Streptomyces sp. DSM 41859]MDT0423436.1 SDR family oxidoreductase [Streptomyces sp. DSM 41859]